MKNTANGTSCLLHAYLTAHSTRVGAALSMAEADILSLKIQRAGGWNSAAMPARYTEQASHAIGGMTEINKLKR
jgi:hypothetical protein